MKITKVCSTTSNPACDEWSTLWFFFGRQISFIFSRGRCQSIERPTWARSITHPAAGFVPTPPFRYPSQTSIFIIPIPPDQTSVILEPHSACLMHIIDAFGSTSVSVFLYFERAISQENCYFLLFFFFYIIFYYKSSLYLELRATSFPGPLLCLSRWWPLGVVIGKSLIPGLPWWCDGLFHG